MPVSRHILDAIIPSVDSRVTIVNDEVRPPQAPFERQLSILDPLSDRVSTILVWKSLTVSSREDKNRELFKKFRTCNQYVPKRKILLNDVSGAIAGGLWAVMGK